MRGLRILISILIAMVFSVSCEKDIEYEEIGNYYFQFTITFDSKGGEKSIVLKHKSDPVARFSYGYDGIGLEFDDLDDYRDLPNFVIATSSQGETGTREIIDGGWYHGIIPNNGQSASVLISVDENHTGKERTATILGYTFPPNDERTKFGILIKQKK